MIAFDFELRIGTIVLYCLLIDEAKIPNIAKYNPLFENAGVFFEMS